MDTSSINPASIIDEAVDLSMRLAGTDFPVSIFPTRIQRIISEVHECHNYPTDYIAAAILTAIAVGIGNTHLAQIKQGWVESPILYMALIGRPGANKSHPLSFSMKPFLDYDYQQNQVFEKALAKYDELMSMSRKERADNGEEQFPQEPVRKRFLISDVTPEGLSLIHAQNKRGLCLWADELSAWFKNFNRYNNGSEEQFWLSVFSAKTTMSDRKNAKSSIFIKRPYISVIGTIQKKILSELAKGERSSNGFIDRILFVMPNLQQKARWNDKELPEKIEQEWNGIIGKLIQQEYALNEFGEIEPQILLFTEDAKRRLYEWQHHFSELCDRETNDTIVSIYCKLEIYIIRFCLIIQLARWTCGECDKTCIDLLTVERAIRLTEYFKESALNVQNVLNENTLNSQQQTIVNLLPPSFTTAQAIQIAEQNGMKERTFQRFLNDNIGTLFQITEAYDFTESFLLVQHSVGTTERLQQPVIFHVLIHIKRVQLFTVKACKEHSHDKTKVKRFHFRFLLFHAQVDIIIISTEILCGKRCTKVFIIIIHNGLQFICFAHIFADIFSRSHTGLFIILTIIGCVCKYCTYTDFRIQ